MMQWVEYMTSDADSPLANLRRQNGREKPWKLKYFGVGNESWGCGGTMTPEFYSDQFRRYNTFVKDYPGNPAKKIYRIACGASDANYTWTDVLMNRAGKQMNGLSLHYYTLPTGNWQDKGSATEFDEARWHATLRRTLEMDNLIAKHSEIMDKYDPQKRVGLVVDEWGTWYDVEPGENPGFLYQQNTLRDAIVAAFNFHIFQRHADRVAMANIAQMINVLQAVILTDKEKMLLTPTYYVFEMFKVASRRHGSSGRAEHARLCIGFEQDSGRKRICHARREIGRGAPVAGERQSARTGCGGLQALRHPAEKRNRPSSYGGGNERSQHVRCAEFGAS